MKCFHCGTILKKILPADDDNQAHDFIFNICEILQLFTNEKENVSILLGKVGMINKLSVVFLPRKNVASFLK